MSEELYREKLQAITENEPNTIKAFVSEEAIEHDNITSFFNDLAQHGCISGMVGSLIYYNQTHQFFETYYDEIEELRSEYEEITGIPLNLNHDLKNTLSWFAFEYVAYQLAQELEIL